MVNPQYALPDDIAGIFCAVRSREVGEPLFGTALHNDLWFLLEYDGPWGAKATTDNDLPAEVQAWLALQTAAVERGRLQFIKQQRQLGEGALGSAYTLFIVDARELGPRMWRFQLADYADLLQIDVGALLNGGDGAVQTVDEPLYLVCTNGRRDRCCALFGLEVYDALREIAGDAVWQTTHVGGHRFAANVITFPDGTYYGRVEVGDELEALVQARLKGEVVIERLRGRSCYEEWVQAADYYLRVETGERRLDAFVLEETRAPEPTEEPAAGYYEATFAARGGGQRHVLRVQRRELPFSVFSSCGKPGEGACETFERVAVEK